LGKEGREKDKNFSRRVVNIFETLTLTHKWGKKKPALKKKKLK